MASLPSLATRSGDRGLPGRRPPVPAGATFGSRRSSTSSTRDLRADAAAPSCAAAVLRGRSGRGIHAEIDDHAAGDGQRHLHVAGRAARRAGRRPAGGRRRPPPAPGSRILPASTHPFDGWQQQVHHPGAAVRGDGRAVGGPGLRSRTSAAATCTSGVPDLETAVAVMDRARPYLPVLLAMTGSSPFHDGVDTGYESYRTLWWSRWPMTGPPEYLGSAERFQEVVAGLVASGVIADGSHLYWDVRPSYHLPDAGVPARRRLHRRRRRRPARRPGAVARAGAGRPRRAGRAVPAAAAGAAAGGALAGRPARASAAQLFDPVLGTLVDARLAVRRLLAELEDDLREPRRVDRGRASWWPGCSRGAPRPRGSARSGCAPATGGRSPHAWSPTASRAGTDPHPCIGRPIGVGQRGSARTSGAGTRWTGWRPWPGRLHVVTGGTVRIPLLERVIGDARIVAIGEAQPRPRTSTTRRRPAALTRRRRSEELGVSASCAVEGELGRPDDPDARASRPGGAASEALLHDAVGEDALFVWPRDGRPGWLDRAGWTHRAIGVVYRPERETRGATDVPTVRRRAVRRLPVPGGDVAVAAAAPGDAPTSTSRPSPTRCDPAPDDASPQADSRPVTSSRTGSSCGPPVLEASKSGPRCSSASRP